MSGNINSTAQPDAVNDLDYVSPSTVANNIVSTGSLTVTYSTKNFYGATPFVNGYLDTLVYRAIPGYPDDVPFFITSVYNYRPDLLANDLYGDSNFLWVFRARNPNVIDDLIFDFVTGTKIYIPKIATINSVLGL